MIEVICEAGITHEGSLKKALALVDIAKAVGGKIVKFQTFVPDKLLHKEDPARADLERLALPFPDFVTIAKHCEDIGIEFMSTPGDVDSLKFLVEECGVKRIKVGSDDLTHQPIVHAAYNTRLPVILSTGMATKDEIQSALPTQPVAGLTLLHCTSLYPCPLELVNLRAMDELKKFGWPVGYSDHTDNVAACMVAMSRDAVIIEKHFKPDEDYTGPDAEVSATPVQLRALLFTVKSVELMLGNGKKEPSPEELKNRDVFRKGPDGKRPFN
jgi:N,N'-diacetyllegionaminate synthase